MSDCKKYYYLKLKENFFDSDSMILLENMQDGYIYSNILLKLYLKSLKDEGRLVLNDRIPYNSSMIAGVTRQQVGTVEKALNIFEELGLIERLDSGVIYMMDIQSYIGRSSTEADRKREYRQKIEREKQGLPIEDKCPDKNPPEIEKELELKIDIKTEIEGEIEPKRRKSDFSKIINLYNDICISYPKVTKLSDARKKAINARLTMYDIEDFKKLFELAEQSSFLKGGNNRNWRASFDWLIKDANMAKVLDKNYIDNSDSGYEETTSSTLPYRIKPLSEYEIPETTEDIFS